VSAVHSAKAVKGEVDVPLLEIALIPDDVAVTPLTLKTLDAFGIVPLVAYHMYAAFAAPVVCAYTLAVGVFAIGLAKRVPP
jgi:hypothetical protein